jgi:hypothetical protein
MAQRSVAFAVRQRAREGMSVSRLLTRFPSLTTADRTNQSSIAASAGVIFTFGKL